MAKLSSTHIYGDLYVDGTISGALSGNASTATTLQTGRTINGTSFNGSSNITTANWGTARTITIGNTGKSVNGSGNVSWTLAEIGAAAATHGTHVSYGGNGSATTVSRSDHTHSYLPLSGGTLTGNVTLQHGTASKEAQYVAKRTDTGVGVFMGVGSGGENHGVYSQKLDKWMVYADGSKIYLQGNADTATKLATTRAIKIGNKSLNFDGSAAITYTLSDIGAAAASHGTHLDLGTTSSTAYRGDYGNTAYKHSQAAHAPSNAQKNSDITKAEIEAKLTGTITSHTHASVNKTFTTTPIYNPSSGILIDFNTNANSGIMAIIKIYGNSYSSNPPIEAIYQFYDYADGDLMQQTGSAISGPAITLKVYRVGGKLKAWFQQPNSYCTFKLEVAYGNNNSTPNVTLSNAAEPTGATQTVTITPNRVYSAAYKPTAADIGAAAASHGTHLTIGTGAGNAAAGNHTHSYLSTSGGQVTGKIYMPASATTTDASHPTQLAYGLLGAYGTLKILGNTDTNIGEDAEYVHIAAGWGLSPAADKGITVHGTYANCFGKRISTEGHSHSSFNIRGDNTITSTSNDTTANWGSYGNSVHWYTATGQLTDQPAQWGYILNIGKTNEVHQIWMTQASGDMFHRGGNANGWSGSWRKLLDSSNWSSYAAPVSHNHTRLTGEVLFPGSGSYTDPWSGTTCCIKGTGNIGCTGGLRANGGVATLAQACGTATSDGATYVALFRYGSNRGICDVGTNGIPGRLYIRSGQGATGSGVSIECAVTNGTNYLQYVSPESGTIALTKHLSDRTRKNNIVYVGSKDSEFTNKDFYDFIRDDLGLATYNYNKEYKTTDTHTKLNFIAQDILYDIEHNCENKVGNLIVQAEDAMEQQGSLSYDPEIYTSVIAGALKESINKIEELEDKNKKLEERLAMLEEKFSALENK
jgi:hypothetical protein